MAAVADEVVDGFPLVDVYFLGVFDEGVLGVVASAMIAIGQEVGADVGAVHAQETPVVAAPCDGGFGHGVGPGVVPDDEHVFVDSVGFGALYCKPLSLNPEIVSIVVAGLDHRLNPDHPIRDINHATLQLKFRVSPFHALPARKLHIAGGRIGRFDRYKLHH